MIATDDAALTAVAASLVPDRWYLVSLDCGVFHGVFTGLRWANDGTVDTVEFDYGAVVLTDWTGATFEVVA